MAAQPLPPSPLTPPTTGPLPLLSVVIVARNEALNLPRCLASVQGWAVEIVVALNETTDGSAAIARQHRLRARLRKVDDRETCVPERSTMSCARVSPTTLPLVTAV